MSSKLLRFYKKFLVDKPFLSQSFHTGMLMGASDLACQYFIEEKKTINWTRTFQFSGVGFFYVAPIQKFWYKRLEYYTHSKDNITTVVSKLLLDQLIFAPVFLLGLLFICYGLQGYDLNRIYDKIKEHFLTIYKYHVEVWTEVQIINFVLVPYRFQYLISSLVVRFWNVYLSWKIYTD